MRQKDQQMSQSTVDELSQLDWKLEDADTDKYSATIHPYHARFIPQIPKRLIENFTEPGEKVLDPFNGSGTTTMISSVIDRPAVGVDLNPLACLIASVKCTLYDIEALEDHIDDFLREANKRIRSVDNQLRLDEIEGGSQEEIPLKIPDFPDKERWYIDSVLKQMGALFHLIHEVDDEEYRGFYKICFSAITKPVCRSQEDWTYIGDNMYPDKETNKLTPVDKNYDVYSQFETKVNRALRGVKRYAESEPAEAEIHQADSRNLDFLDEGSINFAVTSPPYANAVDYARYHRLSFYWLGYPVTETKEDEVGARSKRGRKSAVEDYFQESRKVYEEVYRVLSEDARFAIVVGNSQRKKEEIETVDRIRDICEEIGYSYEGEIVRELARQSMSQKEITEESIIIVSK